MRTRVGYCGGATKAPTYRSIGDHTEAISIDFDPTKISYTEILSLFWASHHSLRNHASTQYRSVLFYRSEEQKAFGEESFREEAARQGVELSSIKTHLEPLTEFTYAERYHQSYYLSRYHDLRAFLEEIYSTEKALADSTVATRLNAFLGSGMDRDWSVFLDELPHYGLPGEMTESFEKIALDHEA